MSTEPMTAERRVEIRDRLSRAQSPAGHLLAGANLAYEDIKQIVDALDDADDLADEVDRLRALWADIAKIARNRKAEAEGRRLHNQRLEDELATRTAQLGLRDAEIERLREAREAAVRAWRVEHDALDQTATDVRTAQAERDVLAEILVTQVQLHRDRHPDLGKRLCQTCDIFRELAETETFEAAEARLFGAPLHAIATGNYVACPAPEDQSEDLDQGHDDLPAVREFVAGFDPREES